MPSLRRLIIAAALLPAVVAALAGPALGTPSAAVRTVPMASPPAVRVLLVGDSVAWTLGPGVQQVAPSSVVIDDAGIVGCGVVRGAPLRYFGSVLRPPPACADWPGAYARAVRSSRPQVVGLLVGRWEVMDRVHAGRWTHIGEPAFDRYLATELDTAIRVLSAHGARVALLTAPYYLRGLRPDGGRWPEDNPRRVDAWNRLLAAAAARHAGTVVLDLGHRITPGRAYRAVVDGVRMRYDGVHLTVAAGRHVAPWLLPRLTALVRRPR